MPTPRPKKTRRQKREDSENFWGDSSCAQILRRSSVLRCTGIHAFEKLDRVNEPMLVQLDGIAKTELFIVNADSGCDRCSELARGKYRGYSPELISLE